MHLNRTIRRPASLRHNGAAIAATLATAALAVPAVAQSQGAAQARGSAQADQEVQLDTLKIQGRTADVNPYAEEGAPYKAKVSGDSRRTRPLAETPTTITVITEAQIKESGRTDLRSILQLQPGVTIGTGENGNKFGDRYIIRGQELKSDVFVDGLRDPGMTIRESFNVEQVELTKGPSSTFAGRGSAGGAVNAITKKATTDYNFLNTDVTGGTYEYARVTGDANLKLSDEFALRLNGLYGTEEVPERGPAYRKRFGAAVSVIMKPSSTFTNWIDYYHLTAHDRPDLGTYFSAQGGVPVKGVPSYTQTGDFVRSVVNVLTAKQKWELGDKLRIENSGRFGKATNGYITTGARGTTRGIYDPVAPGAVDATLDGGHQGYQKIEYLVDQLNLIADLDLAGMKHSLVFGGELSHNEVFNGTYTLTNAGAPNCATGTSKKLNSYCIFNGATDINNLLGRTSTRLPWSTDWKVDTKSIYLMDTVDVAKWLTLFGGVRLDSYDYTLVLRNPTTLATTPYANKGDLWNYHAGVSLKPGDDGQVYFSFGTATNINGGESDVGANCGYGGFCVPSANTTGGNPATSANYFGNPVKTTNYEVGTKWELFGHKLLLTAAAFHLVKDGVFQTCSRTDPLCTTTGYGSQGSLNTGKYRVEGIEVGFVGNITSRLSGQAGFSALRSRVLESSTTTDVGKKLSNFADLQGNAQLKYQVTDGFAIGGNVNYRGSMATGQPDTAAVYNATTGAYSFNLPAYVTFDAFSTLRLNKHLDARVNVQNIGNKDYYLAGYRGGTFVYIGDKRRVTVTLSGKF